MYNQIATLATIYCKRHRRFERTGAGSFTREEDDDDDDDDDDDARVVLLGGMGPAMRFES